jgi:YidC/Oxa1 family membrane protein insertase
MPFLDPFLVNPLINLLVAFYQFLSWLHVPFALGFAIILMTGLIRLLMFPLTEAQLRISKKMQDLAPHMAHIKEKHKGDMRKQQEATMALYKEHNVNPAAGCLPGIVQIVILLFGLYPALMKILGNKPSEAIAKINDVLYFPSLHLNQVWDTNFFGMALEKTPAELFKTIGLLIILVPIATGLFQFVQSKMMTPPAPTGKLAKKTENKPDDFATTFQKQATYLLPAMIAFFSWNFSIGLSLYWNTYTIFGIIQQYMISGIGGFADWIKKPETKK